MCTLLHCFKLSFAISATIMVEREEDTESARDVRLGGEVYGKFCIGIREN